MQQEFNYSSADRLQALLHEERLGEPVSEYRVRLDRQVVVSSLLASFFFLFFLAFGLYIYWQLKTPALAINIVGLLVIVVALVFYIRWLIQPWLFRGKSIYVCEYGLAWIQTKKRQAPPTLKHAVLWNEIVSVAARRTDAPESHSLSGRSPIYTLRLKNGTKLVLHGPFEQMRELGRTVEQHVIERLLPDTLAQFQSGQQLIFGPIVLDHEGIADTKQSLLWHQITRVEANAQTLDFALGETWGKSISFFHENVPNGALLVALVESIVGDTPFAYAP